MAKKSTTKVYGFKATPMREQFKRERELLMRQIRRYERKGYGFDSSVKAMVPEKERAGQRITKKYIESLRSLRASIADYALRITDDGELIGRTAREDTHYRRGEHAQAVKRENARARKEMELRRQLKEGLRNEKPVLDADGKPVPIEAQYAAADREAGLIPPGEEPEPDTSFKSEPEPYATYEPQYGPGKYYSELPNISDVIIKNFLDQFSEFSFGASGEGARAILSGIRNLMQEHGKDAVAKAITEIGYNYGAREVSYNPEIAGAALKAINEFITGQQDDSFESDGGYWPGDDMYE